MSKLEYSKEIDEIRKLGFNPFAHKFERNTNINEIRKKYDKLKADEADDKVKLKIAGRIRSVRGHGKLFFMDLEDFSGRIQLYVDASNISENELKLVELFHQGDIVGVEGSVVKTKRGELSVLVKKIEILTRALIPLPKEWFGLKDEETRYRKRYLDILMNSEIKDLVVKKSLFWNSMREFLIEREFIEVFTPVLENTTGGADARPFTTHHNALDIDVYLRISCGELWQKRLMVSGFEKTFEIGRIFRNEGISPEHAQDYTQMEFYWAYADYKMGMELVEELYKHIAEKTFGTLKFKINEFDIDLGKKWEIYDYVNLIKEKTGIDINDTSVEQMENKLKELKIVYSKKGFNFNRAVDNLWKYCRKNIGGPGFLVNVPVVMEPLAKRNEKDSNIVERFQVILAGSEMGKGYSELNDPIDQEARFDEQAALREAGDEEAQMNDEEFVEALKHGMPPTCGFGVSERLFSFLAGKPIRECQAFPLLRPKEE